MSERMRFQRRKLPIGDDEIPVLVASEGAEPRAVFMSYEAFLELAATVYTAIEALREADVDPSILASDEELSEREQEEFAAWDETFRPSDEEVFDERPRLRLVAGG